MMLPIQIICLGLSFRTTPVEVREGLNYSLAKLESFLPLLQAQSDVAADVDDFTAIHELAILSTCNRIELYACVGSDVTKPRELLLRFLEKVHGTDPAIPGRQFYVYMDLEAAVHLFRVAAGLDSLVLGESQILGQVTDAYTTAVASGIGGPLLSALFRTAVRVGKRARSETKISNNPASIGSVAIALAQDVVGDLNRRQILVIGLGEMGQLTIKALRSRHLEQIAVANRTRRRAEAAVTPWQGQAYSLTELPQALAAADVVISATAAPDIILDVSVIHQAVTLRDGRELVLIDLAVPRDIDPSVGELPGVHLFDIDHLRGNLDEALEARRQEIPLVEAIIDHERAAFMSELREMAIRPLIAELRNKAEMIRRRELQRTLRYLGDVDPHTLKHIHHLSHSLINKLLHEPTIRLRETAEDGLTAEMTELAETVRHLFGLETAVEGRK